MKINTLSVFPEIIKNNCKYGVLSKAVGKKLITINNYSFFTEADNNKGIDDEQYGCLLYTSPSPRDRTRSRMPSSA